MTDTIPVSLFTGDLLFIMEETFESVHGVFLDKGNSLLETLAEISAEEASRPVGESCATIAAQVTHVCFYLDVLDRFLKTGQNERVDWGEVWRTVRGVTPEEWAALQQRLWQAYQRARASVQSYENWNTEYAVGGAIGIVAHTAYHLGEIRQATCTVKNR